MAALYDQDGPGGKFARVGLLSDERTEIVESATGSVSEGEAISDVARAMEQFPKAKFISREVGLATADYISDDLVYKDSLSGISLYVGGARRSVQSISFEASDRRKLAEDSDPKTF